MIINTDLHIHSKYSMATSKNMDPVTISTQSSIKGLDLVATGDALHSKWLKELESNLTEIDESGIYQLNDNPNNCRFITTTEVEDKERIHHLILVPSIEVAWQLRDEFTAKNMDADGRAKLRMYAPEIMDIATEHDCIIGPAHVFTPWTGIFKEYDNIMDCYTRKCDFVELGLSSDTYMAEKIEQLDSYTFLSNSDSHSPWPHRIAREFNRIEVNDLSFESLRTAIRDGSVVENLGYPPQMGKYYETGCSRCHAIYSFKEAQKKGMKCSCGGMIKRGVLARIRQLAGNGCNTKRIRPHYQYILPLSELLSSIYSKGVMTKFVQTRYNELIDLYANEINILLNVPINELEKADSNLSRIIGMYRNNNLKIEPGRGGLYGKIGYEEE